MTGTWFITGTSSGFGRLLTEQLLMRGDRVAATLRRPAALHDLQSHFPDQLWVRPMDVTDGTQVRRVVDEAFDDLGRIDVVVSNAGYTLVGAAEEATDHQIERQFDTNLFGPIRLIRAALPHLREQGGGRVLQVASNVGHVGVPGAAYYSASKFAVVGFCEALRLEVEPFGIGVTIIEPGGAATGFVNAAEFAPASTAYRGTPAAAARELAEHFRPPGDPDKMVRAMIAAADAAVAPVRVVLGSDSYSVIKAALTERLEQVEAQAETAPLTDLLPVAGA